MRKPRKLAAVALAAVVATITLSAPGVASAAIPYEPGSAVPTKLGYDVATWSKLWGCAYAGWASPEKDWLCYLYEPTYNRHLSTHSGSFTGSSKTTPTYYYQTNNIYLCTHAEANYADGSSGDAENRCG